MNSGHPKRPAGNYQIGFGRPPVATRFQPGQSGNPRGRPRGARSIGQMLQQALNRRVIVHENGRERSIRLQDVILQGLVNDAARRDHNALRLLFWLLERYGQSGETAINLGELTADDSAIIERYISTLQQVPGDAPAEARMLAAAAFAASTTLAVDPRDPWRALAGWRAAGPTTMTVVLDGHPVRVTGPGPYVVEGRTVAREERAGHWLIDGEPGIAVRDGSEAWVKWRGETYVFDTSVRERSVDALASAEITAPMPGVVLAVHARPGQRVRRGDLVCVVEAMKMELRV